MTPDQKAARDAAARLTGAEVLTLQSVICFSAVRAMVATHPEPEKMRAIYDQLIGQFIASPAVVGKPGKSFIIRDLTATLFEPPIELDT